jgi:hypothetical protein
MQNHHDISFLFIRRVIRMIDAKLRRLVTEYQLIRVQLAAEAGKKSKRLVLPEYNIN